MFARLYFVHHVFWFSVSFVFNVYEETVSQNMSNEKEFKFLLNELLTFII